MGEAAGDSRLHGLARNRKPLSDVTARLTGHPEQEANIGDHIALYRRAAVSPICPQIDPQITPQIGRNIASGITRRSQSCLQKSA
jgi:hypothetical protein